MSKLTNQASASNITSITGTSLTSGTTSGSLLVNGATTACTTNWPYSGGGIIGYSHQNYSSANIEVRLMENGFLINCGGRQFVAANEKDLKAVISDYLDTLKKPKGKR